MAGLVVAASVVALFVVFLGIVAIVMWRIFRDDKARQRSLMREWLREKKVYHITGDIRDAPIGWEKIDPKITAEAWEAFAEWRDELDYANKRKADREEERREVVRRKWGVVG